MKTIKDVIKIVNKKTSNININIFQPPTNFQIGARFSIYRKNDIFDYGFVVVFLRDAVQIGPQTNEHYKLYYKDEPLALDLFNLLFENLTGQSPDNIYAVNKVRSNIILRSL